MNVRQRPGLVEVEVFNVVENKRRHIRRVSHLDMAEIGADYIVEYDRRPQVVLFVADLDVAQRNVSCVANEESVTRHRAETVRIRISGFHLSRLNAGVFPGAAALMQNEDVAQTQVFNGMPRNAGNDRSLSRSGV